MKEFFSFLEWQNNRRIYARIIREKEIVYIRINNTTKEEKNEK